MGETDRIPGKYTVNIPFFLTIGLPLVCVPFLLIARTRATALRCAPWGAVPALLLAVFAPLDTGIEVPWMLLGVRFGLDATGRIFLLFTALIWTCAGVYAGGYLKKDPGIVRFFSFYLAAMAGNLGLILAQDLLSFYLFFSLMSFTAYGLVIHDGTDNARTAGRVYLALVVFGELCLISALFLIADATGSLWLKDIGSGLISAPTGNLIIGLILVGFGIKAGAFPVHVWLPLAHPVAPTPASAVLSGAMIKAGLIGWLRFLPLGALFAPTWGAVCIIVGLTAAIYGVVVGLTQRNPKTILAYSSISQMGYMTTGIGVGFMTPDLWTVTLGAIAVYAFHHGLAKGALFLSVGIARKKKWEEGIGFIPGVAFILPALALAGAPFTSGAMAKQMLKEVIHEMPGVWFSWLSGLLSLAAVGTTVLMGRFLWMLRIDRSHGKTTGHQEMHRPLSMWGGWAVLVTGVVALPCYMFFYEDMVEIYGRQQVSALWPVLIGVIICFGIWKWSRRSGRLFKLEIPAGDILGMAVWLWNHIRTPDFIRNLHINDRKSSVHHWLQRITVSIETHTTRVETRLVHWVYSGAVFIMMICLFIIILILG